MYWTCIAHCICLVWQWLRFRLNWWRHWAKKKKKTQALVDAGTLVTDADAYIFPWMFQLVLLNRLETNIARNILSTWIEVHRTYICLSIELEAFPRASKQNVVREQQRVAEGERPYCLPCCSQSIKEDFRSTCR